MPSKGSNGEALIMRRASRAFLTQSMLFCISSSAEMFVSEWPSGLECPEISVGVGNKCSFATVWRLLSKAFVKSALGNSKK